MRYVGIILGLTSVVLGGCRKTPEVVSPKLNVVIVLVDAMRADRLGPYGFVERSTTPELDRFAAESVVFENAVSQCGWTVPSVATLFTGVYPQTHGVLRFIDPKVHLEGESEGGEAVMMDAMSMDHQTLAEQFSAAGYSTAAILKSDVINAGRGFEQGFEYFHFVAEKPKDRLETGAHLTDAAVQWLKSRETEERPFFLYLHYMDPHTSYIAPEPFYSKYSSGFESSLDGNHGPVVAFNEEGSPAPTDDDVGKLLALYDGEVEYWDTQFARLMEYFETSGLADETIIVVTADHGEAFWEHELFEHRGVFQENILVPMIFRIPGVVPKRVSPWVQMADIGPTVADLVGVERGPSWVGLSHAGSILSNEPVQEQAVSSEWAGERTLITPEGLKIILGHGEPRLYDLKLDPGETQNLATQEPKDLARLKKILEDRFQKAYQLRGLFSPATRTELTPEQIEALRELGYLEPASE